MLVHQYLERSANRFPEKTALICGSQRLTYSEINDKANRIANSLISSGFRRGDRAILHLPNTAETVITIFGVLKAGGVFSVLHPSTPLEKVAYILQETEAKALFAGSKPSDLPNFPLDKYRPPILIQVPSQTTPNFELEGWHRFHDLLGFAPHPHHVPCIDLDLATIIYTSGSTGEPKGVMSDHSNVDFATDSIISYLENTPEDIVINFLPLSFDYGLYQLLMVFKFGGTLVLEKNFAFPAVILEKIQRERVTGFPGVPTIYATLLQMDLSPYDLSSIRYMTNTAAALSVKHIQQIQQRFPWVRFYSMYGLTETKRTLYLPPEQLSIRPQSVGIPIPGTEVWIEDDSGHRLPPGEVGELVVRGRHVMRGYWADAQATAERFRPGPLPNERVCYTGDLFTCDEEGYFYFVARKDDVIKSGGEKVAPLEIERVISQIPEVSEVAAIGVPDPILGQAIEVYIVSKSPHLTRNDVIQYCIAHLESFKVPREVHFVTDLPKTDSGKINKQALKESMTSNL